MRQISDLRSVLRVCRRIIGGSLIVLVVLPIWRLISLGSTRATAETLALSDRYAALMLQGTVVVLALAATAAVVLRPAALENSLSRFGQIITSWNGTAYAVNLALLAGGLTTAVSFYLWDARPIVIDALAQFIQARYIAEGMLAAPSNLPLEFWIAANTLATDNGWVSQYPPGHMALLAVGFRLGAVWAVCPVLMASAALFTALTAERLLPNDRIAARLGALLFAVSPYLMVLAAAQMSHVTAAAFATIAAYCAVRARDGSRYWASASGFAVGAMFVTRPMSGIIIGAAVTLGVWLTDLAERQHRLNYLATRMAAALAGALPLLVGVAAYNAHFFASAFQFGYTAYLGPNHGFGFHVDPFGNPYQLQHGIGYTSSDLLTLGYFLFRTPVSAVWIVGVFLLVTRRLSPGASVLGTWALSLVVPMLFYWHHDLLLGPRMLSDAAPAWCVLAAIAALTLVRAIPADRRLLGDKVSPRVLAAAMLLVSCILGYGYLMPRDLRALKSNLATPLKAQIGQVPALVFVHDSWNDRMVAQLVAGGMRADSVAVALTRNSSCRMQEFVTAYRDSGGDERFEPPLQFGYGATDGSEHIRLSSGVVIRALADETLTEECQRQADADRNGTVPLMPLLWQGDLPGLGGRGTMYVRDLGPESNTELLERFPRRRPAVLLRTPPDRSLALVRYQVGMEMLWGQGAVDVP